MRDATEMNGGEKLRKKKGRRVEEGRRMGMILCFAGSGFSLWLGCVMMGCAAAKR